MEQGVNSPFAYKNEGKFASWKNRGKITISLWNTGENVKAPKNVNTLKPPMQRQFSREVTTFRVTAKQPQSIGTNQNSISFQNDSPHEQAKFIRLLPFHFLGGPLAVATPPLGGLSSSQASIHVTMESASLLK